MPPLFLKKTRFKHYFSGIIYLWNKYDECVLYSAASYGGYGDKGYGGSKVVSFKLSPRVCANYYSDKGGYSSQGYRVMIQYDPNIVSHEDVNFVAKCDSYSEPPRELYMQYTTIDAKPIYLTVRKRICELFEAMFFHCKV